MEIIKTYISLNKDKVTFRTPIKGAGVKVMTFSFELSIPKTEVYLESLNTIKPILVSVKEINENLKTAIVIHKRGFVKDSF